MASSCRWVWIFIAVAMAGLAGCANPTHVPDDAKLIYSGSPIKFASLEPRVATGTMFIYVYDDELGKMVKEIKVEPQYEFEVINIANGHDIHVYESRIRQ